MNGTNNMRLKRLVSGIGAALLALAFPGSAAATSILTIYDTGTGLTKTIVDDSALDLAIGIPGVVSYAGSLGVWVFSVSTGYSKPALGSTTTPDLHLDGSAMSSGAGTLTVTFTDDGFGPTGTLLHAGVGGATDGTVKYETFKDATALTTFTTSFGEDPYAYESLTDLTGTAGPYTLKQKITITHTSSFTVSSFDATLTVPDGGTTLSLLGLGLIGVSILRSKLAA